MNLKQAIIVLDSTIPPSNNKMVDMEHLPIAQAWETIKAALKLGQIQNEGRLTAYSNGLPYFPECFKEPCSGMGCKKKDCEFMTDVCRKLATFEDDEERRTPQRPEFWGDGYDENGELIYDQAKCPNCGNTDQNKMNVNDDFEEGINNWGCKFCPDCGQALNWEECD